MRVLDPRTSCGTDLPRAGRGDRVGSARRGHGAAVREGEGERDLCRLRPERAREGKGRLGREAAPLAHRADLRRRRPAPAAAALRRGTARPAAHRLGRLLPPVRLALAVRRADRRAARRRRERHPREQDQGPEHDGRRRTLGKRALRQLPLAPRDAATAGRLPAGPRDELRRRARVSATAKESFASRTSARLARLVSFVQLTADATSFERLRAGHADYRPRAGLTASEDGALERGDKHIPRRERRRPVRRLLRDVHIAPGTTATVYAAWFVEPAPSKSFHLDEDTYTRARDNSSRSGRRSSRRPATYEVPREGRPRTRNAAS
jgi:hypothetical protein